MAEDDDEETSGHAERRHGLRFDKSISVGTLLIIVSLLVASYTSVTRIIDSIQDSQFKVNVMWKQFLVDHPENRYWRGGE